MRWIVLAGVLIGGLVSSARPVWAYIEFVQKAKKFGSKDCTFCHSTPRGMTGWNRLGQWLIREKIRRNADHINVEWLKDNVAPKPTPRKPKASPAAAPQVTQTPASTPAPTPSSSATATPQTTTTP
ncbi:MAG: hypothetical protein MUF51_06425 [Vicinamibacteria bacterium]|nr:hypothetical protein [Vicinamibacteria bacterium]